MIHDQDVASVIGQVCRDVESTVSSDLDPNVVPYALDKAIRNLHDSGVSFARLVPFIHIGL